MTDQLISFETAKLAKEKGFTNSGDMMCWVDTSNLEWNRVNIFRSIIPYMAQGCDIILQPTQSLLQKWLRDKHNIHIVIKIFWDSKLLQLTYACDLLQTGVYIAKSKKLLPQNTYEEALEEGLQKALNLII